MTVTKPRQVALERGSDRPPTSRTVVALMAGTVVLIWGVGVGVRHWMVAGLTWGSGFGLAALVVGMIVVGSSIAHLGRNDRPIGRWIRRTVAVLAVSVAVWTFAPALMATMLPHVPSGPLLPGEVGLIAEPVTFSSRDGVTLGAWYIRRDGPPIILRHGAGSDASTVLSHARALADTGYTVLVTDARGHGRSGGKAMDFGWFGDLDIEAAIDFLSTRGDVQAGGVAVVGMSMGGEEAVGAAAADGRIRAVVAEGATARTAEDKRWLADVFGFRGRVQVWLERAQYGLADLLTPASAPISLRQAVTQAAPTPVLLVAAGELEDETRAATYIRDGSPGTVSIWVAPRSRHAAAFAADPVEWTDRVSSFLDAAFASPDADIWGRSD